MGLDRLVELLSSQQYRGLDTRPDAYVVVVGGEAEASGLKLAEQVREQRPELKLQLNCGGGGLKSQLKKADRSGAELALILGEKEVASGTVAVKFLRGQGQQVNVARAELGDYLHRTAVPHAASHGAAG
jgi:histidyl-tRNA synthetase